MQPPARRADYRAEKNQSDPTHQRRCSAGIDLAKSEAFWITGMVWTILGGCSR
jgi:hypothetical protein